MQKGLPNEIRIVLNPLTKEMDYWVGEDIVSGMEASALVDAYCHRYPQMVKEHSEECDIEGCHTEAIIKDMYGAIMSVKNMHDLQHPHDHDEDEESTGLK